MMNLFFHGTLLMILCYCFELPPFSSGDAFLGTDVYKQLLWA